jgi:phosphotriesterase-related protein
MPPRDHGKIRGKFAYDMERAEMIARLIADGYGDRLLVTNDICLKTMLAAYGGNGFMHVARTILPMLRYVGVAEADIQRLVTTNPANFLDF